MRPTIVLVRGAFAESTSWSSVVDTLAKAGQAVIAAANPLRGLAWDAAAVGDLVRTVDGPVEKQQGGESADPACDNREHAQLARQGNIVTGRVVFILDASRALVSMGGATVLHLRSRKLTQHPTMHLVDVICSTCGTEYALRSTATARAVDVCGACHPAYTGRERAAASGSRIERFNRRRGLAR